VKKLREDKEIFRDIKEKEGTMDLIYSKVRKALNCLDTVENNDECNKAILILFQTILHLVRTKCSIFWLVIM
jgi:hypothetical protein